MNPKLAKYMLLDAINTSEENGTPWSVTGSETVLRQNKKED